MGNRSVREIREGGKLPTLSSSPLIKIRVFNWSKLIYYFFLFIIIIFLIHFFLFLFWLCGFLALCSFIKSLLLVNIFTC
jgi:hypothetical protein